MTEQHIVERLHELCCSCGEEAANYIEQLESRRCATCKHWTTDEPSCANECFSETVRGMLMIDDYAGASFCTKPDFCCNKWEVK